MQIAQKVLENTGSIELWSTIITGTIIAAIVVGRLAWRFVLKQKLKTEKAETSFLEASYQKLIQDLRRDVNRLRDEIDSLQSIREENNKLMAEVHELRAANTILANQNKEQAEQISELKSRVDVLTSGLAGLSSPPRHGIDS